MIQVNLQTNTAQRVPLPQFLKGLKPESLKDLSWTDPALNLHGYGWWPELDQSPGLSEFERHGGETLTVDADNQRVIVVRAVVPWSQSEIDAHYQDLINSACAQINDDRDERLAAGVEFDGIVYQSREIDHTRVNGLYSRALRAQSQGSGTAGDYRWFNPEVDFSYTAADNSEHLMDADTVISMGEEFANRQLVLIKYAQSVKGQLRLAKSKFEIDAIMEDVVWP
ncbi:MAG: hypothetical protein CMH98_01145 [Oceanospirillaceae bacterium]|nr:hypothetical protein [Oceanospirillaceae bacterium]